MLGRVAVLRRADPVRAPCRPQRVRRLEPEVRRLVEARVCDWLVGIVDVRVTEWVSMDSRAAPHITRVWARSAGGARVGTVPKKAVDLDRDDVVRCLAEGVSVGVTRGLRARTDGPPYPSA